MRDSIVFYRSFYEAIKELSPNVQAKVYNAIFEYSLNFNEVELSGLPKTIFTLIKPQLEANNKKFENGKKGAEFGKLGGRPKPQNNPNETPNVNDNVECRMSNVNENDIKGKLKFSPPSLLEVQNYIIEKKYGVNAHSFWNFYESKNWMVGKNKMKDYKKAIAGWESREKENSNNNQNGKQFTAPATKRAYKFDAARIIETNTRQT